MYKGRVALDRILFGIGVLENEGPARAIERLVGEARMQPATADRLVAQLEEFVFGEVAEVEPEVEPTPVIEPKNDDPAPKAERPAAPRLAWAGAAAALLLGCLALWSWEPGSVEAGDLLQEASISSQMVDRWTYRLNGRDVEAKITTKRKGFDSVDEWRKSHSQSVRASKAALPPIR